MSGMETKWPKNAHFPYFRGKLSALWAYLCPVLQISKNVAHLCPMPGLGPQAGIFTTAIFFLCCKLFGLNLLFQQNIVVVHY